MTEPTTLTKERAMQFDLSDDDAETLRVTIDGQIVSITTAAAFISSNRDALSDHDILELRAGRRVQLGGGAAPLIVIEPETLSHHD